MCGVTVTATSAAGCPPHGAIGISAFNVVCVAAAIVGHGTCGCGSVKSKSKSRSKAQDGLHESPVCVWVTTICTLAFGTPPQGATKPVSALVVAVAEPLSVGHGITGFGSVNAKSKSKSTAQDGLQESPVCVGVTTRPTVAAGSPPHGAG